MNKINKKIYNYEKHLCLLKNIYKKDMLPNATIISGLDGIGKKTFILHFLLNILNDQKLIGCLDDYFTSVQINNIPNIKFINCEENKNVGIDNIRNLIINLNLTTMNGKPRFIIISNIENLNINAINALLKIIENPPFNTFFFLLRDQDKYVVDTLTSRCFKFNIKFLEYENNIIFKKLLRDNNFNNFKNFQLFNKFDTAGSKIKKIFFLTENNIENLSLLDIIIYCLNDYNSNKNFLSINNALYFSKNFFYIKFKKNFLKCKKFYNNFKISIDNCLKFNQDLKQSINIFNSLRND